MPEAIPSPAKLETCLNLLRHLNPSQVETNLNLLSEALPELKESLKEIVDVPSRVIVATEANNREFLSFELAKSCSNCYRCPWDDKFYTEKSFLCSDCHGKDDKLAAKPKELNQLEKSLNEAVSTYSSLYYGSDSITSVYVEGTSVDSEFKVAILIKKRIEADDEDIGSSSKATWDSVHLFEINPQDGEDYWIYQHTATIMLSFDNSVENLKNIKLAGNLIRQNESKHQKSADFSQHLGQIGCALEESESRLRSDLQSVYFGRTHDIVNELRSAMPEGFLRNQTDFREEMMAKLKGGKH